MPSNFPLSGVVITKNEADRIVRCVKSLFEVCREVIVLDSGSSDDTVRLAREAGARVEHQQWLGFSCQKNAAIELASQPWVFLLDADEWCENVEIAKIQRLIESPGFESADVWTCKRQTYFLGKFLSYGGREREPVQRIFRSNIRYSKAHVHEKLETANLVVKGANVVIQHDTARSYAEYATKLYRYAALFAEQNALKSRKTYLGQPAIHASFYWLKNYVIRLGFMDGLQGFHFHRLHTGYVWIKYKLLAEKNAQKKL